MNINFVGASRPEWKKPKHIVDQEKLTKLAKTTIEEGLPSSLNRLAWLNDRDHQLNKLLDYLQSSGIPMGSETWALRALLFIRRMISERDCTIKVLNDYREGREPDLERLKNDFEFVRRMELKSLPEIEDECDWCGWSSPNPRLIGHGYFACEDCLPIEK